ncbi:MAG: hypothetical protein KTR31_17005 [Myxococcales bacterium]|nr:hypothetical protein [Myxococcales bacterium]
MARFAAALIALLPFATSAMAGYQASTFKKEDRLGKNYWNAASALDNDMETCWQVDAEAKNEGSWIQIDTPTSTIDKIAVATGWNKSEELFFDYARIKTARVEMFTQGESTPVAETTITFEDKMGWQELDLPDTKVGGEFTGGVVKLTVLETYAGRDFPALAVSEVRVHLKEFPAATLSFGSVPDSEQSGHDGSMMMDGSSRTFWAAEGPTATFSLTASGYGLSSVGIQQGPKSYARPKTIKIVANQAEITHTLEDLPGKMQWALLPWLVGYTGGAWGTIEVQIVDTYEGTNPGAAIAEVKMTAGSIEEF